MAIPGLKGFQGIKSGQTSQSPVGIEIIPMPLILVGEFEALAASIRSFRVPLERSIRQVVIPSIKENFDVSGRPAWEPLSSFTEARREEQGYGGGIGAEILIRTGRLKRAATAFARWSFTKEMAFVGNAFPKDAWYGPIQQNGFQVGSTEVIPSRPFMMIQDEDQVKIEAIFTLWFQERLLQHGFHK